MTNFRKKNCLVIYRSLNIYMNINDNAICEVANIISNNY